MIAQRFSQMMCAKKEEPYSDFLQSLMFNTVVSFHDSQFKEYCNLNDDAVYFITDCYTYITRDRQLMINSIIETELNNNNNEELNQLIEDLKTQDDYYCNGIATNRKLIFNKTQ
jgi:hypothetical protein